MYTIVSSVLILYVYHHSHVPDNLTDEFCSSAQKDCGCMFVGFSGTILGSLGCDVVVVDTMICKQAHYVKKIGLGCTMTEIFQILSSSPS